MTRDQIIKALAQWYMKTAYDGQEPYDFMEEYYGADFDVSAFDKEVDAILAEPPAPSQGSD